MKKILLLAMFAVMFALGMNAQQTGNDSGQPNDSCLVVWHKNGTQVLFNLKEKPEITYEGDSVVITSPKTMKFHFKDIKKMTFVPKKKIIGDVNNDKAVNMADLFRVLSIITFKSNDPSGDVNEDGTINVADIISIVNVMDDNPSTTDDTIVTARRRSAQSGTDEDGNQQNLVRIFMSDGQTVDFGAPEIDRIISTTKEQTIWYDAEASRTIPIENIDSIWYISPVLKLTTKNLDFGKVAVGYKKSGSVTLINTGQYTESYFLLADGVFNAANSGKEIKLAAGESQSIELSFEPEDSIAYSGNLMLSSSAFENGSLVLPLLGEGVGVYSSEEDAVLPPVEEEFELVLTDEQNPESLTGFKILNSYGEFPISTSAVAAARRVARADGMNDWTIKVGAQISPNWMQANFLMDGQNNPYLFVITLPGEKPKMSVEQTAISLLMSEPLLMTSNEDEYRNTVRSIKDCKEEWKAYLAEVKKLYDNGVKELKCPDYSSIDTKPLLKALAKNLFDNSEMTLSGVSLVDKDIDTKNGKATLRVHNDLRRTLHIYPSRVRFNDNTGAIIAREDISPTLTDKIIEWVEAYAKEMKNTEQLSDEDIENLSELKEMVGELETLVTSAITNGKESHIHLPIELDSQHSNYWKIVKGSWNGDRSSPFAVTSDPIEITYEDYDQALIDVYGLGTFNKPWDNYTGEEQLRIIFALLCGGYKDFIKPAMDIAAGVKSLNESMADAKAEGPYKYDLRYGSRKYPLLMLVVRLGIDLLTEGQDTYKKVKKDLKEGDKLEAAKDILEFLYDRICVKPKDESTDSKRSYYNLIYNCYKNITNDPKKSKEFRDNFKKVANNLNVIKKAGFIGKVVSLSELGLDLIGSIDAVRLSQVQETFHVNKSKEPYISIIAPKNVYYSPNNKVYFEWSTYKGMLTTQLLYDLEIIVETPDKCERTIVLSNMKENCCEYDLSQLPDRFNARRILFRIIARHPENLSSAMVFTDDILLVNMIKGVRPKFIDLGLPSGTLWADCNMGANQAVSMGNYYAWGETRSSANGKTNFGWNDYRYANGSNNKLTKYCTKSVYGNNGFTDNLTELQGSDDPASDNWGYWYSIPTKEEWEELVNYCDWKWIYGGTYSNGVYISSRKNDEHIFLPVCGYRSGNNTYDQTVSCQYWSSTLDEHSPDDAWFLNVYWGDKDIYDYYRCQGRAIRPVLHPAPFVSPVVGQSASRRKAAAKTSASPVVKQVNGMTISVISTSASQK